MKSISQIDNEINGLQVQLSTSKDLKKSDVTKIKKRHSFLKICKMYIESNTTHEFLNKEKDRLQNKVNLINAGYVPDKRLINSGLKKEEQKEHQDYNKIMDLPKFKEQLRSVIFLLS